MAKVSLRIYNREIESLVDRGELEEAIAHCRHILNIFPKNLETYRLIGKAYLEARRYEEATDIFERVLMAVPDDFVAHVGMSIIHDEQQEMDAAIWHMQRAFEVQPSNTAIQSELQRLFGRRDGVEPPKIRLTRGALAHMYVQGELYPQAISEINAVLEEDSERHDMQVLLARAYFHAGQKNEAAEMCSQLLRRYPYCLDANRVLVELLPETERGESTVAYRKRVNELDPYATFTTGSVFHTDEVPDAAVSLDRLEWDGQAVEMGQDWGETRGIGLLGEGKTTEEEPDWLKSGLEAGTLSASSSDEESASAPGSLPIPTAGGDDDIPDFLREAGWGENTGTFKEGSGSFDSSEETDEPALAEGDLPDWIKAMAPTGADIPGSTPQAEEDDELTDADIPDWLQGLGSAQDAPSEEQPAKEGELPDWLAAMKPGEEAATESQPQETALEESSSDEAIPDWLADMKASEETAPESQPQESAMVEASGDEGIPDWLADLKEEDEKTSEHQGQEPAMTEASGDEGVPDWLVDMKAGEETVPESSPQEATMAEISGDEDIPDWLMDMKESKETAPESQSQEPAMAEGGGDEDIPDWLKTVQEEEAQTPPEEISQATSPEPVESSDAEVPEMSGESLSDWQISEEETTEIVDFDATDTGVLGTSAEEQDDAIAWLEGLAAKHGAKPEELVTDPEARSETEPEWVQQAKAVKGEGFAEAPEMSQAEQEEQEAEIPTDMPEPLAHLGTEEPTEEPVSTTADVNQLGTSAEEQDDAVAWLESLAAKHGAKPEELVTDPESRSDTAPEWVQKAAEVGGGERAAEEIPSAEIPDWLEQVDQAEASPSTEMEGAQTEEALPSADTDETGIWLQDMEDAGAFAEAQEPATKAESAATDDDNVPEWLREIESETSKAETDQTSEEEAPIPDWLLETDASPSQEEGSEESAAEEMEVAQPVDETVGKIDLNTASPEQLAALPGIGDLLAMDIVAHRETYGYFSSVDDLSNVAGIGPSTIDELRDLVEFEAKPDIPEWLSDGGMETSESEAPASDDLPAWLAGLDEEKGQPEPAEEADRDLPEWLKDIDGEQPAETEPTAPTDWQPEEVETPAQEEAAVPSPEPEPQTEEEPVSTYVEPDTEPTGGKRVEAVVESEPEPEPEPVSELESKPEPEPEPESEPEPEAPITPEPEPYREPVTSSRTGMTGMLSPVQDPDLAQAQNELTAGNISAAMEGYGKMIRKGKMLDEIIFDLREALYRYPVDVSILQALGDAYMRANRLQDALDAYTKAEELLR